MVVTGTFANVDRPLIAAQLFGGLALGLRQHLSCQRAPSAGGRSFRAVLCLVLAVVVGASSWVTTTELLAALLFVGLGLVFFLLYLLDQKRRQWWALIPGSVLLVFGVTGAVNWKCRRVRIAGGFAALVAVGVDPGWPAGWPAAAAQAGTWGQASHQQRSVHEDDPEKRRQWRLCQVRVAAPASRCIGRVHAAGAGRVGRDPAGQRLKEGRQVTMSAGASAANTVAPLTISLVQMDCRLGEPEYNFERAARTWLRPHAVAVP